LEKNGVSGETFHAVAEYLLKTKPRFAIFENVCNTPWDQLQDFIQGALPMWCVLNTYVPQGKGQKSDASDSETAGIFDFVVTREGTFRVGTVPRACGVRPEAILVKVRRGKK
jgi:hypothetical protein